MRIRKPRKKLFVAYGGPYDGHALSLTTDGDVSTLFFKVAGWPEGRYAMKGNGKLTWEEKANG